MTSILLGARERGPFAAEGGRTEATFERAVLADGTPVVVKHVSPDGLFAKMLGGSDQLHRLWSAGVFGRIPGEIDHTILAIEAEGNGWLVVMRDRSDAFLGDDRVLSRQESRRVLRAVDAMHKEFWSEHPQGAWSLQEYYKAFLSWDRPKAVGDEWPIVVLWRRGWELFPEVVPPDVAEAMQAILADPVPLALQLEACDSTLIHGDLRLHNLGLTPDRVVLLDWELVSYAPPAVEFAWYLVISASRVDATRE